MLGSSSSKPGGDWSVTNGWLCADWSQNKDAETAASSSNIRFNTSSSLAYASVQPQMHNVTLSKNKWSWKQEPGTIFTRIPAERRPLERFNSCNRNSDPPGLFYLLGIPIITIAFFVLSPLGPSHPVESAPRGRF